MAHPSALTMDALLGSLAHSLDRARSVEELARPLLQLLETVTGLESTYLTLIDLEHDVQRVLYARNTRQLHIPEGLEVAWSDTLCKRALDEQRPFTDDVDRCWADSQAAQALGIKTYASAPVRLADGVLYGTLCAASAQQHALDAQARQVLALFACLIAHQVERERLLQQLLEANARLATYACTDTLTGLPNRRGLVQMLQRALAQGAREGHVVLVAFIDLDGFKAINDRYGHEAGDQVLVQMAQRLQHGLRAGDTVARLGGDEFLAIAWGPRPGEEVEVARQTFCQRIAHGTAGRFDCAGAALDYPGASVGAIAVAPGALSADDALREADHAMYTAKRERRRQRAG